MVSTSSGSNEDDVCNVSLLTHSKYGQPTNWYGFTGTATGTNTLYANKDDGCLCSYTFEICETRRKISCNGTYPIDYSGDALCATDDSDWTRFVAGNQTDIYQYGGHTLDNDTETCSCSYVADNCLDDADYRDNFLRNSSANYSGPNRDVNDPCDINFRRPCCNESELAFGGVAISDLNLSYYLELAEDSGNGWACLDGDDFCDSDYDEDNAITTSWFSWVYNEDDGANGFDGNSLCQCWVRWDDCVTDAPTSDTSAPTEQPTKSPSLDPTASPTNYQFDDYDTATVAQPCCGNESITDFTDNTCPDTSELRIYVPLCF